VRVPACRGNQRRLVTAMPATTDVPWRELHQNLRLFVGRRVRNQADVEDLVQRVLLHIVQGLSSLRDSERLHAWVYRSARNVIADYYRSPASRREVPSGDAEETAGALTTHGRVDDEREALPELAACLAPMLRQLSPDQREAVVLTELEGITQAEAAARAGVSVSGMKSRVQRGRRQLRAILDACCRIDLDVRGGVVDYAPRSTDACGGCGDATAVPPCSTPMVK
jgi:RNA polymerase sigma-70 factor (ECF subfamily)